MRGEIPDHLLEQIRAANDIVDVIGASLPLKRAGASFVTLCPFHREKTPSFHVNPQRQIFHCFGCHKGGDVFTFVREYENLSFLEAVRRLAERGRIPLELRETQGQVRMRSLKESLLQVHEQIVQRWQAALQSDAGGQGAREYLARRGVSPEAVKRFRLGYAPAAWDDTVNWARGRKYELAMVEQGGLIIRRDDGGYYDRFRGRLMFPICDEQGRVIAFSGRILEADDKTAKYVNSPETPLFTKSKVMYGLDKSRRAMLDAGRAVICEGQLDLIACYMAGVQNVVAPQGTALTAEHCRILKRHVEEVVLCFDSDAAGQNAAERALDDLLASGLAIRVASIPAPHDPDSYVREHGAEAFRALLDRAQAFFDFRLERLCALHDLNSDRGRAAVARSMAEGLAKSGNAVWVDTYARKTAQRLGVGVAAVLTEFGKVRLPTRAVEGLPAVEPGPAGEATVRPSAAEFQLLRLVLQNEAAALYVARGLDPAWIQHAGVRDVLARHSEGLASGRPVTVAGLVDALEGSPLVALMTEAAGDSHDLEHPERQVVEVLRRVRDAALDREAAVLNRRVADPATPESEREDCLRRKHTLILAKRQPMPELASEDRNAG